MYFYTYHLSLYFLFFSFNFFHTVNYIISNDIPVSLRYMVCFGLFYGISTSMGYLNADKIFISGISPKMYCW